MERKQYEGENRRKHFRIQYPVNRRPKLIILDIEYEVIDISEQGIRFLGKKLYEFEIGSEVKVKIVFYDRGSLDLKGKILRVNKEQTIIYLSTTIPFERIAQEQRYVRDNYSY